ncbi:MAG: hypothetical protein WBE20_08415 [Candidatus Acidiferrales bacterium]
MTSVVSSAAATGSVNNSKAGPDDGKPSSQPAPSVATTSATAMDSLAAAAPLAGYYLLPPPAFRPKEEPTVITRERSWLILSAVEHGSAGFDAWSTRRAISQGRIEADPVMRPFANSPAIYGAIQVVPLGLDYVARHMEHSTGWSRHVWWVPQSLATAAYLFSGSYNVAHTH